MSSISSGKCYCLREKFRSAARNTFTYTHYLTGDLYVLNTKPSHWRHVDPTGKQPADLAWYRPA